MCNNYSFMALKKCKTEFTKSNLTKMIKLDATMTILNVLFSPVRNRNQYIKCLVFCMIFACNIHNIPNIHAVSTNLTIETAQDSSAWFIRSE